MTDLRQRLEDGFARMTGQIYRRKFIVATLVVVLTAVLAYQAKGLVFDTRDETFFRADDPTLLAYNAFRDQFGQDDVFIVALRPEKGLNRSFLATLYELHLALESRVPYLDDITSLVNGRVLKAEGDTLMVEELMRTPPASESDRLGLLATIDRYPLYESLLISTDRTLACILIKAKAVLTPDDQDLLGGFEPDAATIESNPPAYLSNAQNVEIAAAIKSVVSRFRQPDLDIHLSGTPAFVAEIQKAIERDLSFIVPASLTVIIILLSVLFRKLSGVLLPLLTVVLSLLSALGIMAMVGFPITNVIQILPTFLIVVGVGDSVHILTLFYRIHRRTGDKRRAIVQAVSYAGLPVLMTSLTTACGLLSFAWADVASVAQLGLVAAVGVMLAFGYTLTMLPALIAIVPIRTSGMAQRQSSRRIDRLFRWIARVTTRYPVHIILAWTILLAGASYFAVMVRLSHNSLTWFPETAPVRLATEMLDQTNGGTVMLEVLVDSGTENGLHEPDLLDRLDEAADRIAALEADGIRAGKTWSIVDPIKEINRALHEDKTEAYVIPPNRELIAQELLLFEASGSDDLEEFADSAYRIGRLSVLAPFNDAVRYKHYTDQVSAILSAQFPAETVTMTGHIVLFIQIIRNFITSMIKSYSIALVVITILMVMMIGRVRIGLMSMVANVVPILCIFGLMGLLSIPLDMATILIGSIVLGLVVDDTIHFLHHFRRAYDRSANVQASVYETLSNTGRALLVTSLVLCGGFFVYTASFLESNVRFGLLSGCAVLFALLADFLLVPALLFLVYEKAGLGKLQQATG